MHRLRIQNLWQEIVITVVWRIVFVTVIMLLHLIAIVKKCYLNEQTAEKDNTMFSEDLFNNFITIVTNKEIAQYQRF